MAKSNRPLAIGRADTWEVKPADRTVISVALKLLTSALKDATNTCRAVGVTSYNVEQRTAQLEEISSLFFGEEGEEASAFIPLRLLPTLRVGLSLQHDWLQKVFKMKQQGVLGAEEENDREKQLERLFSDLDVQLLRQAQVVLDAFTERMAGEAGTDLVRGLRPGESLQVIRGGAVIYEAIGQEEEDDG